MNTEIPKYWKMRNKVPFGLIENSNPRTTVYIIAIFRSERKQAILVNKNLDIIGHMETRYAQKLINEANEQGWVSVTMVNTKYGPRDTNYPEMADLVCWIEVKR